MPKIAVIYASRTGKTRKMADAIANGARSVGGSEVVLKDASRAAPGDVSDADAIILGGATYNSELIPTMNPFLDSLEGVDLKGKVGAAFGSYGWSGEGVPTLIDRMKSFGMSVIEPGTTAVQAPTKDDIEMCFQLGKRIAGDLAQ